MRPRRWCRPRWRACSYLREDRPTAAIQALLGDAVRVVSAFQNISASHLDDLDHEIDCEVLVCGDDPAARGIVIALAADIGLTAWHAGPIANSAAAEALTSVMIFINRHYKSQGSGIRVTGVQRPKTADDLSALLPHSGGSARRIVAA